MTALPAQHVLGSRSLASNKIVSLIIIVDSMAVKFVNTLVH